MLYEVITRFALHASRIGLEQPEEDAHQRGFTGAVGPDQGHVITSYSIHYTKLYER